MEGKPHKIEFWDSRISGKKKLCLDDNQIMFTKDKDFFYSQFKIGEYTFNLNHYDTSTELLINSKKFKDLMKEERSGILDKEKQNYLRKHDNNNDKKEYNNNYILAGENIYDIKEQKRLLEEFERKKRKEKEKVKSFYVSNEQSNISNNKNKNKFILDDKTVNNNRLIICNIQNIFDDDNEEDEFNFNDFKWDNASYNPNQINKNKVQDNNGNKFESNININVNQINNNINNQHNQEVINQFFDFTQSHMNNNSNSQYPNFNNINNNNNNKYDDDFNPFLD